MNEIYLLLKEKGIVTKEVLKKIGSMVCINYKVAECLKDIETSEVEYKPNKIVEAAVELVEDSDTTPVKLQEALIKLLKFYHPDNKKLILEAIKRLKPDQLDFNYSEFNGHASDYYGCPLRFLTSDPEISEAIIKKGGFKHPICKYGGANIMVAAFNNCNFDDLMILKKYFPVPDKSSNLSGINEQIQTLVFPNYPTNCFKSLEAFELKNVVLPRETFETLLSIDDPALMLAMKDYVTSSTIKLPPGDNEICLECSETFQKNFKKHFAAFYPPANLIHGDLIYKKDVAYPLCGKLGEESIFYKPDGQAGESSLKACVKSMDVERDKFKVLEIHKGWLKIQPKGGQEILFIKEANVSTPNVLVQGRERFATTIEGVPSLIFNGIQVSVKDLGEACDKDVIVNVGYDPNLMGSEGTEERFMRVSESEPKVKSYLLYKEVFECQSGC